MIKELLYFSLMLLLFASCEEAYHPKIDIVKDHLIIESLITNDPSHNYVLLTKGTSFYDESPGDGVSGAKVYLIDGAGNITRGIESSSGNFHFDLVPTPGHSYKLQISYNNDTYESEAVTMPPIPHLINFYTERIEKIEYQNDGFGNPAPVTVVARELYADLPVTPTLSCYRFGMRSILEWYYTPPMILSSMGNIPPPVFGWLSVYYNDNYNIAGPNKFSLSARIEKHPLVRLPYGTTQYIKPDSTFNGWIFMLDQYGTSQASFDYHNKLNSQFLATGNLFDPIQTQITGNITCKTDSTKKVYGYFDLNSYRKYRYYLYFTNPRPEGSIKIRELTSYPNIPDEGLTTFYPPDWWEEQQKMGN